MLAFITFPSPEENGIINVNSEFMYAHNSAIRQTPGHDHPLFAFYSTLTKISTEIINNTALQATRERVWRERPALRDEDYRSRVQTQIDEDLLFLSRELMECQRKLEEELEMTSDVTLDAVQYPNGVYAVEGDGPVLAP